MTSDTTGALERKPLAPLSIAPESVILDDHTRVLKCSDTFGVFDRHGDCYEHPRVSHGIYHRGTRFVTGYTLKIAGYRPLLLDSTIRSDNRVLTVDLANPDVGGQGPSAIPADTLHVVRSIFLRDGACHEQIHVTNHGLEPVQVPLEVRVSADFADIFEVRGSQRARRGRLHAPRVEDGTLLLRYVGLDDVERYTRVRVEPAPQFDASGFHLILSLPPKRSAQLTVAVECVAGPAQGTRFAVPSEPLPEVTAASAGGGCSLSTSNQALAAWLRRSHADLALMLTRTPHGNYPYAGVPWFNTAFGRDGIITGLQALWLDPTIARGVLRYLAQTQATEYDARADAEPGKIVHEMREGEMAALGEVPFARYYGSVDSTPLFVMLAGEYYEHSADRETLEILWPHIEAALDWIDANASQHGDGFVTYARRAQGGLVQQGWKDSGDSVFHAAGELAEAPIALCEVQAYVYAARRHAATLAEARDQPQQAASLRASAEVLRERFESRFWSERLGTYVLALDGKGKRCEVTTSNAGHCLYAGIADPARARRVARGLMREEMFSGWGVRTLGSEVRRYNPMSYHNGSVWPHDNAIVAAGLARYGFKEAALRILEAMLEASVWVDLQRMPELYCGFPRRPGHGPTRYPVACAPQAWAAGSPFMLLAACLGLHVDAATHHVAFSAPHLPSNVDWLRIDRLAVGDAQVDLVLRRVGEDVAIEVTRRTGPAQVTVVKSV